jgi:hypothetical protein
MVRLIFMRFLSLISLLMALVPGQGADTNPDNWTGVMWGLNVKGKNYSCHVLERELATTPKWNPETEAPPVSAATAIKLARGRLSELFPSIMDWQVARIELALYRSDRWYYAVEFESNRANPDGSTVAKIPVLMNGKLGLIESNE